jgi:hypothetical protein
MANTQKEHRNEGEKFGRTRTELQQLQSIKDATRFLRTRTELQELQSIKEAIDSFH